MPTRALRTFAVALAGALLTTTPVGAPSFAVVVNERNPITAIGREQLSSVFLKKAKWTGRVPTVPVDLREDSPVRAEFSQTIHRRPVRVVAAYWRGQIFSGGAVPPSAKASDAEVLAFVRSTPGAIGYVSVSADVGAGVKIIAIRAD